MDLDLVRRNIYLLTDSRCGSACEALAAAARILETRTAGAVIAAIVFKTPWRSRLARSKPPMQAMTTVACARALAVIEAGLR